MLLKVRPGSRAGAGADERVALEKGIAEAQASIAEAGGGTEHADLRATLAAFIAQCEKRIAEIRAATGR